MVITLKPTHIAGTRTRMERDPVTASLVSVRSWRHYRGTGLADTVDSVKTMLTQAASTYGSADGMSVVGGIGSKYAADAGDAVLIYEDLGGLPPYRPGEPFETSNTTSVPVKCFINDSGNILGIGGTAVFDVEGRPLTRTYNIAAFDIFRSLVSTTDPKTTLAANQDNVNSVTWEGYAAKTAKFMGAKSWEYKLAGLSQFRSTLHYRILLSVPWTGGTTGWYTQFLKADGKTIGETQMFKSTVAF